MKKHACKNLYRIVQKLLFNILKLIIKKLFKMADKNLIITVRVIRSFHHRNLKNLVLKNVNKNITVKDLKEIINRGSFKFKLNVLSQFVFIRNIKK